MTKQLDISFTPAKLLLKNKDIPFVPEACKLVFRLRDKFAFRIFQGVNIFGMFCLSWKIAQALRNH